MDQKDLQVIVLWGWGWRIHPVSLSGSHSSQLTERALSTQGYYGRNLNVHAEYNTWCIGHQPVYVQDINRINLSIDEKKIERGSSLLLPTPSLLHCHHLFFWFLVQSSNSVLARKGYRFPWPLLLAYRQRIPVPKFIPLFMNFAYHCSHITDRLLVLKKKMRY